jgi:hypothetical protein
MFWRKKTKFNWWLVVFGTIALVIIMVTIILVANLFLKEGNFVKNKDKVDIEVWEDLAEDIFRVKESYKNEMRSLSSSISKEESSVEVFKIVEESFFRVRVPGEMRDLHLQVLLDIFSLKESDQQRDVEVTKNQVLEKIKSIIENIEDN